MASSKRLKKKNSRQKKFAWFFFWKRFKSGVKLGVSVLFGLSLATLSPQSQDLGSIYYQPIAVRQIDFKLSEPALYPQINSFEEPLLTASGAAILDRQSGVFIYTKNPDQRFLPASTVKIMTALVALENYSPLEVLMVPQVSDEGQDMGLVAGELITVEALLYGTLVSSANDAAMVLSQNYWGGEKNFVSLMNKKAKSLGLKNSFFANSTGLDHLEGKEKSFSSARDLAWLADYALRSESFAQIVRTKQITLQDPQFRYSHQLYNLNRLLWENPQVVGVKTGWTPEARECLVTAAQDDGKEIILVVLGSEDRFGESQTLLNWVFSQTKWEKVF
ncbi:D-alanyl-D-alanine carboxypeptidase family protein [Patescibacteria group bacterium]